MTRQEFEGEDVSNEDSTPGDSVKLFFRSHYGVDLAELAKSRIRHSSELDEIRAME
jgi:hypothetical protein